MVKASTLGRDYWVVGTYDADTVQFTPVNGTEMGMGNQLYDYGQYYASKSFFDPSTGRQVCLPLLRSVVACCLECCSLWSLRHVVFMPPVEPLGIVVTSVSSHPIDSFNNT